MPETGGANIEIAHHLNEPDEHGHLLLLIAIGQRFRPHRIRLALVTIALLMLIVPIWRLLGLPRM